MRTLKIIAWTLLAIIMILSGISAIISKKVTARAEKSLGVPPMVAYNILNNTGHTSTWLGLPGIDTTYVLNCAGISTGTGASCDYTGKQAGSGVIRILNSSSDSTALADERNEGSTTFYKFRFTAGDSNKGSIIAEASSVSGFWSNLFNFYHRWRLEKQLDHSLKRLAELAQKRYTQGVYNGYTITRKQMDPKYFITFRSEVEFGNASKYYSQNITALYQRALDAKVTVSGNPCGLFYKWDDKTGKTDMAAALPVLAAFTIKDAESITIPAGEALFLEFTGDNSKSGPAHTSMDEYMSDHGLRNLPPVIEEYLTDPTREPDPSKWITHIIYYVESAR